MLGFNSWFIVSKAPDVIDSCELQGPAFLIMIPLGIYFFTLVGVVPIVIINTVYLCRECYRHKGGGFEIWSHVVKRVIAVMVCVVYTIGGALWIVVELTVAIPPSEINTVTSSPLATWQIVLLVVGGILLGIVLIVALLIDRRQEKNHKYDKLRKLEWWRRLYLLMWSYAVIFCVIGMALFIAVGVVLRFNPPNGNVLDRCWCSYRDGHVVSGFVFSILALIYAIAAVIFVVHRVKHDNEPTGKRASCFTVVMIILLAEFVVGAIVIILLVVIEKIKKGCTGDTDGRLEEVELLHFEPTVNKEGGGGSGGQEDRGSQVRQSLAVLTPSDPNYSNLKEDVYLPSAENKVAKHQPSQKEVQEGEEKERQK